MPGRVIGTLIGGVVVLIIAACSGGSSVTPTGPSTARPVGLEVRVEKGGGSGGGGVIIGDADVNGTYVLRFGPEVRTGTYRGFVSLATPTRVSISVPGFQRTDDSVFSVPIGLLDSSAITATLTLGVSPNPTTAIVDFRVELDSDFTATADPSCPTGERHTFVLSGPIPQFGLATFTFSHCAPVL